MEWLLPPVLPLTSHSSSASASRLKCRRAYLHHLSNELALCFKSERKRGEKEGAEKGNKKRRKRMIPNGTTSSR